MSEYAKVNKELKITDRELSRILISMGNQCGKNTLAAMLNRLAAAEYVCRSAAVSLLLYKRLPEDAPALGMDVLEGYIWQWREACGEKDGD